MYTPLYPNVVKRGIPSFLIFAQNIDCGYSLEPPQHSGSKVYPQSMFCGKILKVSFIFLMKFSIFTAENVCIMHWQDFVLNGKAKPCPVDKIVCILRDLVNR